MGHNEAEVRHALRKVLTASTHRCPQIVEEFWVPRSHERADMAVIDTSMHGYEIKTARDTLKRLPRQVSAYNRLFSKCTIVLAERHLPEALKILPEWWGIMVVTASEKIHFATYRVERPNPEIDPETLVRLLWRDEVHAALAELGEQPSPHADRFSMWEALLARVDDQALQEIVRHTLLYRDPSQAKIATRRFARQTTG